MTGAGSIHRRGILFVLSAPSGAGKTTAANLLLARVENLSRSISHTTRAMRPGETDGVDYYFVNREKFDAMIKSGDFIEWAEVHGNRYGTSFFNIEDIVNRDKHDLLLVIDVQGARALREKGVNCRLVFLLPPSPEELARRLKARGGESDEALKVRLANAAGEISAMDEFDYAVINDDLEKAVSELSAIVTAERLKTENRPGLTQEFTKSKGELR